MNDALAIYQDGEDFEVWFGVDVDNIINAHVIGSGSTRDAAVTDAVHELESALEALQSPPGVIREVSLAVAEGDKP